MEDEEAAVAKDYAAAEEGSVAAGLVVEVAG